MVTTGPGRICVTCPWMPKDASFCRSLSAVAVSPSRSSGTACDASPVRMVMGGGTNVLCPGAMVKLPAGSADLGSWATAAFGRGAALGSTICGGGALSSRGSSGPSDLRAPSGCDGSFLLRPLSSAATTVSLGSRGASCAAAAASASAALLAPGRDGSTMRPSSPAKRSWSPNETVRALLNAAAAPRTARAPPNTPSFAAPRAACSAQRSVATTRAAPATALSRTAAPGTESAARAVPASVLPTAPPAGCPCSRPCTSRSKSPIAQNENNSHEAARANDKRGRPSSNAHAAANRKSASA